MLSEKMLKALNEQINVELYSSYIYLSMSAYFESINLDGFASWMYVQSREEEEHAMKFFHYITDRGGRVSLDAIAKPQFEWKSPEDVFEVAYKHEQKVTGMIHNLVDMAMAEKDHATFNLLQWYVNEQVEEEASASKILDDIKMLGTSHSGIYMLNRQLGNRAEKK